MPDYIPFPNSSGGNPRQIHSDYFVGGQNIKCTVTATADNVTNSGVTATDEAVVLGLGGVSLLDIDNGVTEYLDNSYIQNQFITRMYTPSEGKPFRAAEKYIFFTYGDVNTVTDYNGVQIDWKNTPSVEIPKLVAMSLNEFTTHVTEITNRINATTTNRLNALNLNVTQMRANGTHVIIDPEFLCYDNTWIDEICNYHIRTAGPQQNPSMTFTGVSSNESANRGLYMDNSGFLGVGAGGVDGLTRFRIMRDALISTVEHTKTGLQYDKVSFYDMVGLYQDDVARIATGAQGNPNNTDPATVTAIYQAIKDDPELAPVFASVYTNNITFYPGNGFSANKATFDAAIECAQAVFPTDLSMWFNENHGRQGNSPDAGDTIFRYDTVPGDRWGGLDDKFKIDGYDVKVSGLVANYPASAGTLSYIAKRLTELNVRGIFLFPFGNNDGINDLINGDSSAGLPDQNLAALNNGPDTVTGVTFTKTDYATYYDWYFDTLTRFLFEEPPE